MKLPVWAARLGWNGRQGIGCRYPGGADSPQALWRLLCDGVDAISPIPPDRFDADSLYDPRPSAPGKIAAHFGGFLREPLDQFDAAFFGISPREAMAIDPQQRLLLEIAWEALEDAGLPRERLAGVRGGVYVGMWSNEYEDRMYADIRDIDLYVTTGGGRYSASGRLSYIFDLQGPSLTLDTACSSSLVAVHLACQSLRDGESTIALAGGVNLILQPHISIGYSRSRMLSPDGRCKFGDARANGYVRSEGAGMVVLKTLSQALADGDRIYSLVLGSAVNNDGHSSGLLVAPSGQGQEAMLREAYRQAGIVPGRVHYVEAHGTGTGVGDPTELGALGHVLSEGRPEDDRCVIGSIKTNIGHTEAASGVAGLIKAALCLQQRCIPPSLHFQTPNPNIPWDALRISIPTTVQPWPDDSGPAYAGVNSFGITGTNAHLVLQSPPQVEPRSASTAEPYLLPISAETPEALAAAVEDWRSFLAAPDAPALADIAYSAAVRRTHLEQRLAIVAGTPADAVAQLAEHRTRTASTRLPGQPPRIAFVFPGQGGQWIGMGRELLADEPVFKQTIARCAAALQPHVDWSLVEQLTAGPERSRLEEIDVVQPVLFAIQVALASLWKAWGVQPAAVVGHSMGEVAAAAVSGALSLDDAARIICTRSRLMKQVSGKGAMALVGLSRQDAEAAIRGYEDRLSVAVNNGPRSAVIAGDPLALSEVVAGLERREVFCRPVNVDVAAHSPHMDALRAPLVGALSDLQESPSAVPLYSTVTGQVQPGDALGPDYWGRNLREPVLFSDAVQRLLDDGFDTFVEINPHPILLPAIAQADPGDRDLRTVPSLRREAPERATLLEGLAELYTLSQPIDWPALYPTGRCVTLPAYPWQRERFWYESDGGTPRAAASGQDS